MLFRKITMRMREPGNAYALICGMRNLGMGFHCVIYTLFLRSIGILQHDISLLNAFFWAVVILSELPTGMLADGKSRGWSVKAGFVLMSFSLITYAFAGDFWTALIPEVLIGIAMAFLSGAEQAWITDALNHAGQGESLKQVYAKSTVWASLALIVGGCMGEAVWRLLDFRASWLFGSVFMLLGTLFTFKLMDDRGEPQKRLTEKQALKASIKALGLDRGLFWAVLASMVMGLVNPFNHFWSQFFEGRLQGAPLSLVWIPLYGSCAAAGFVVRRLEFAKGQETGTVLTTVGITGFTLWGIGFLPGAMAPLSLVMLHEIARGAYFPLADVFVQRRVESGFRATYGSLHSFLGRMGNMAVLGGVWFFTRRLPDGEAKIISIWSACGVLMVLGSFLLFFIRPKQAD